MLDVMRVEGIPATIEPNKLPGSSRVAQSQLVTTLRFLKLINAKNEPLGRLRDLVASFDTSRWGKSLADLLRDEFPMIFEIPIASATPGEFSVEFRKYYHGTNSVLRKSQTFLLHMVHESDIPLGEAIAQAIKPRNRTLVSVRGPRGGLSTGDPPRLPLTDMHRAGSSIPSTQRMAELLFVLLDIQRMTVVEQDAIWTLIKYFKRQSASA
jgi:hypothetical protein